MEMQLTSFITLSGFINAAVASLFTALILFNGFKHKKYIFLNVAIVYWSFMYGMWQLQANSYSSLTMIHLVCVGMVLVPYAFLEFCSEFSNVSLSLLNKWLSRLGLVTFLISIYIPKAFISHQIPMGDIQFWPQAGYMFLAYLGYFAYCFVLGHWYLLKTIKESPASIWIFRGTVLGVIGASTNFFYWFGIPVPPFGNILVSIYVMFIAYAVIKQDIMDVTVIIGRALAVLITTFLYSCTYLSLVYLLSKHLGAVVSTSFLVFTVLFGLLVGFTFEKVRSKIQTAAEKKFIKGYYNTEEILHTLSTKLLYTYHYESVMSVIATEFLTQLELKNAFTFFLTDQNKFDLKQVGIESPIGSIAIESDFIEFFESHSDPIYLEGIPDNAVSDIAEFKFEPDSLLFAIHSSKQLKGIFVLSPKLSEDTFSHSDMKLLDTITNQIMVVFDRIAKERELAHANSRLKDLNDNLEQKVESQVKEIEEKRKIEKDLEMASTIQRSVLPKCSPKINNYSFHASFYPSRKIGGDYYNFFPFSENEIGILLCDVAGKGISSAIMMMELHSLVHRLVKPDLSPKDFMFQLNNAIVNNHIIKKQVATFYGILNNETHALMYCNGGHDEGYLFTGTQCLALAESSGLSPGFMEDQDYKNEMTSMKNGDALMVFTDGLTDVESPTGEKYGLDRVLEVAKAYRKSKGAFETLGQALVAEWLAFKADTLLQKDDMTLITIEHERLPLFVPNKDEL